MRILSVELRNFRCFAKMQLDFNSPIILISGPNGSGKTSLLEALHYACYFRSFKSNINSELIKINNSNNIEDGFSIDMHVINDNTLVPDMLNITYRHQSTKNIKLNQKSISSYKDLTNYYKVVTITEDDTELIRGYPDNRRVFIDHLILLTDSNYGQLLKDYKRVLKNKNSIFQNSFSIDVYNIWSEKLYDLSIQISQKRIEMLSILQSHINELIITTKFTDLEVSLNYSYVKPYIIAQDSYEKFMNNYPSLIGHETNAQRSLFGAHLDDFSIQFNNKATRTYSSRGQQKLVLFLLKIACLKIINSKTIFLIDDFMTDFDEKKIDILIDLMIQFSSQTIITCPTENSIIESKVKNLNAQIIRFN